MTEPSPIPSDLEAAVQVIREFVDLHGIEFSRFKKLNALHPAFRSLTERRLREWVPFEGDPLPTRKPQRRTRARLVELSRWIETDEKAVLKALGVKSRARVPMAETISPAESFNSALMLTSSPLTPETLNAQAISLAGQGYQAAATQLLLTAFYRFLRRDFEQAIRLLPTIIYVLFRFCSPHEMMVAAQKVCKCLERRRRDAKFPSPFRELSLFQLAAAFSEGGHGRVAGELLLHNQQVHDLIEAPPDGLAWPRPQLVQIMAGYWAIHGERPQETLAILNRLPNETDDRPNRRGEALSRYVAYEYMSSPNFKKAWEVMEPYYDDARTFLLEAVADRRSPTGELSHLYHVMYVGAITRSLSRKGYSAPAELRDDLRALNWCQQECNGILRNDRLSVAEENTLPPALAQLRRESFNPPLSAAVVEPLHELRAILLGE